MNTVKIGVVDKELQYVERLAAFLNRYEKQLWNVVAFTDYEALEKYMAERHIDMLATTKKELITKYRSIYPESCYIWLTDYRERVGRGIANEGYYSVYRYQSARVIGDSLKDIVEYLGLTARSVKVSAIMYSPVGRCGKTTLARNFIKDNSGGKWLYIGMEDYGGLDGDYHGGLGDEDHGAEDFLYYVKERRKEDVLNIIAGCEGYIPSPFSLFDTRQIDGDDIEWFLKLFESETMYKGVLFDIGTGVMGSLSMMIFFDHIIVPFINDEKAAAKKKHFEELLKAYELEELFERIHFLDMDMGDHMDEMKMLLG